MIIGEYYHLYGRDDRTSPSRWIRDSLILEEISSSSHDADYPVNRREERVYYCPNNNVALSITEYPERGYVPSYMNATSIKGEFSIVVRGKKEDVMKVEEVIRWIVGKQEHAKLNIS